jgi:hypothetical protein
VQEITFGDGTSISGSIAFSGIQIGDPAGFLIKTADGSEPLRYTVLRGDGLVFYTDPDGYEYKRMHHARNPIIIG